MEVEDLEAGSNDARRRNLHPAGQDFLLSDVASKTQAPEYSIGSVKQVHRRIEFLKHMVISD